MRFRAHLAATAFLAVAILAFGGLTSIAEARPGPSPSPNPIPAMTLTMEYSAIMARPTNVNPGAVTIHGALALDKVPGERLYATIMPVIDRGWPVSCSPRTVIFTTNKISVFDVFVVVPIGTPSSQVGTLTIEARGESTSFTIRTIAQVAVTVAPYYYFYVSSPMPYKETPPARSVVFDVQIDNWGNAVDSYDLIIDNIEELAIKGWTVTFSTTTAADVGANKSRIMRMSVYPAFSSTLYKAEGTAIDVSAISEGARDAGEEKTASLQFIVYERGTYIDPLAAALGGLSIFLFLLAAIPISMGLQKLLGPRWWKRRRRKIKQKDKGE